MASPEQHLAKSDRILSEQRDSNVVDVGVLIGECIARKTALRRRLHVQLLFRC